MATLRRVVTLTSTGPWYCRSELAISTDQVSYGVQLNVAKERKMTLPRIPNHSVVEYTELYIPQRWHLR